MNPQYRQLLETPEQASLGPEIRPRRKSIAELDKSLGPLFATSKSPSRKNDLIRKSGLWCSFGTITCTRRMKFPKKSRIRMGLCFMRSCTGANRILATRSIGSTRSGIMPPSRRLRGAPRNYLAQTRRKISSRKSAKMASGTRSLLSMPASKPAQFHQTAPCFFDNSRQSNSPRFSIT